jgi:hypothetical protein
VLVEGQFRVAVDVAPQLDELADAGVQRVQQVGHDGLSLTAAAG